MMRAFLVVLGASAAIIAISCGSSSGPTCGNMQCGSDQVCCNACGTPLCSTGGCPGIECAVEAGTVPCGSSTCTNGLVCCTDCGGMQICETACPPLNCAADSGADAMPDALADAPSE